MEYKTIEESIINAMDCNNTNMVKYLPYILQDFWEIGASPDEIIKIIKKHKTNYSDIKILDLGSGKGAVSVNNICTFETNDIRTRVKTLGKYDVIILGAIGTVLGNYYETLSQLAAHLNKNGLVIIDDAFIEDNFIRLVL